MVPIAKRVVRFKIAQQRLGVGHSKFYADFIQKGRLRVVRLGARSCGVLENELDALIEELAKQRDPNTDD